MQKHPSTSCFETTTKILTINNIEKAQNYQNIVASKMEKIMVNCKNKNQF